MKTFYQTAGAWQSWKVILVGGPLLSILMVILAVVFLIAVPLMPILMFYIVYFYEDKSGAKQSEAVDAMPPASKTIM